MLSSQPFTGLPSGMTPLSCTATMGSSSPRQPLQRVEDEEPVLVRDDLVRFLADGPFTGQTRPTRVLPPADRGTRPYT